MRNPSLHILVTLILAGSIACEAARKPVVPDLIKGELPDAFHDWNLGPTGARGWIWGWNLETTDSRQILITSVKEDTPAFGVLRKGDVILGTNGKLFDADARKLFGNAVTDAETEEKAGRLNVLRWRDGKTESVVIQLRVLGAYHDASPWECRKSAEIVDVGCRYIVNNLKEGVDGKINILALLASGKEEYLPIVRDYARRLAPSDLRLKMSPASSMASWHWGYTNLLLTEYFLATGDREVLPAIREYTVRLAEGQSGAGSWGHTMAWPQWNDGKEHGRLGGYGALNQAGLICQLSLILGKKCGVSAPQVDQAIERGNLFFGFYVGKGSIPYGDNPPDMSFHDDNGKNGIAALLFDAQDKQKEAQFFSRMAVASYGERERGHTGNYFSYLWGALGAMRAGPEAVSAYLKKQRWYLDLNRSHNGQFPYQGGAGSSKSEHLYSNWDCTGAFILSYLLPEGRLFMTGRGVKVRNALVGQALTDTIVAGREFNSWDKGAGSYRSLSVAQLLQALRSWSTVVRQRAARLLAEQEELPLEEVIKRLDASDYESRYGACQAIAILGARGLSAVKPLRELLWDQDPWLRILAAKALTAVGAPAAQLVPDFLKMISEEEFSGSGEVVQRYLAFCLFCRGGVLGMEGLLAHSVQGIDLGELRPAVERILKNPDARARATVKSLYHQLNYEEIKPFLPAVIRSIVDPAPTGIMFADAIRLEGLDLLARHRVREGMELCLAVLDLDSWGKRNRILRCLRALRKYGGAAKPLLPQLQEIQMQLLRHRERRSLEAQIDELSSLIEVLENAPEENEALRSLSLP